MFALPAGLGALTEYQILHVTPSGAPIAELPLALIPTAGVPILFVLHIESLLTLARARRAPLAAAARRAAGAAPRA